MFKKWIGRLGFCFFVETCKEWVGKLDFFRGEGQYLVCKNIPEQNSFGWEISQNVLELPPHSCE